MRSFLLLAAGTLLGVGASYVLMSAFDRLDEAVSQTYRCDQLALEDDAKRSAEKIIQQFLAGRSFSDLEAVTAAAGLKIRYYDKGDHAEIVVGHEPGAAALSFQEFESGDISILTIPGSGPCDTTESGYGQ